jgi:hypothetical protein
MQNIPAALRESTEAMTMIRHLTAQMLQGHSGYVGRDYFFLRQGGLQRLVWPWDAAPAIEGIPQSYQTVLNKYYAIVRDTWPGEELAGIGAVAWKIIFAVLIFLLSGVCLFTLYTSQELLKTRSLWLTAAFCSLVLCTLVSLLCNYPAP